MKLLFIQNDSFPKLGMMYISSVLKEHGHDCDVLIVSAEKNLLKCIKECNPDIIGFSCTTGMHNEVIKTAKKIKQSFNIPIIVGGPHATFFPEMINNQYVDMICVGEGEPALLEFMNRLSDNKDICSIKGIWVKKNGEIYKNGFCSVLDLDKLPYPDRSLYDRYDFLKKFQLEETGVLTTRGCPYDCNFCFNPYAKKIFFENGYHNYIRKRSVKDVINEILDIKNKYEIKRIEFIDDTFNLNHPWLRDFLKEYKKKVNIPFVAMIRASLTNEEIVSQLKSAGCYCVKIGIESANPFLRMKILNKQITNEQIEKALELTQKYKIKVQTFNMLGIPHETLENALETLRLNIKYRVYYAWCSAVQPYPRTQITEYAIRHGFLNTDLNLNDVDKSFFTSSPFKLKNKSQLLNLQKFFTLCAKYPFLLSLVKILIKLPQNRLYNFINSMVRAYFSFRIYKMNMITYIKVGLGRDHLFYKNKKCLK
jgi:anaerobic magnesium-protoporphyrin IX monomethyl ester cyclase